MARMGGRARACQCQAAFTGMPWKSTSVILAPNRVHWRARAEGARCDVRGGGAQRLRARQRGGPASERPERYEAASSGVVWARRLVQLGVILLW